MVVAAARPTQDLVLHVPELDLVDVLFSVQLDLLGEQYGVDLALPAVRVRPQVLLQGVGGLSLEDEAVRVGGAAWCRRCVAKLVAGRT